jgi:malic enzyme
MVLNLLTVIVSTTCCNYKQENNAYILCGFGLGVGTSGAVRVSNDMVIAAHKHNLQDFRKEDHSFLFDSCH